jgi:hypothetical protein
VEDRVAGAVVQVVAEGDRTVGQEGPVEEVEVPPGVLVEQAVEAVAPEAEQAARVEVVAAREGPVVALGAGRVAPGMAQEADLEAAEVHLVGAVGQAPAPVVGRLEEAGEDRAEGLGVVAALEATGPEVLATQPARRAKDP